MPFPFLGNMFFRTYTTQVTHLCAYDTHLCAYDTMTHVDMHYTCMCTYKRIPPRPTYGSVVVHKESDQVRHRLRKGLECESEEESEHTSAREKGEREGRVRERRDHVEEPIEASVFERKFCSVTFASCL
jgi:hypothetical protein